MNGLSKTFVAAGLCVLTLTASPVIAGPPLLCHPIEIGDATSLPWGDGAWHNDKIVADDEKFVAMTLELLSAEERLLVRMETIRRAAIRCAEVPFAARAILAKLRGPVDAAEKAGRTDADALFNYGYMIACCAQMNEVTDHNARGVSGKSRRVLGIPEGTSPYQLLTQASAASTNDPAIEFALALITSYPRHDAHSEHLQKSIQGAIDGSLLAENLVRHFGRDGQTLNDLRAAYGIVDGDRR